MRLKSKVLVQPTQTIFFLSTYRGGLHDEASAEFTNRAKRSNSATTWEKTERGHVRVRLSGGILKLQQISNVGHIFGAKVMKTKPDVVGWV